MTDSQKRTLTEQFMLRLPDGMREKIKREAERTGRSMNSEIVAALELWLNLPTPAESHREDLLKRRQALAEQHDRLQAELASVSAGLVRIEDELSSMPDEEDQ